MLIVLFSVTRPSSKPFQICIKLCRFVHELRARAQPCLKQFKMIRKMFDSTCYLSVLRTVINHSFPQDRMRLTASLPSSPASPSEFLKLQFTIEFRVRKFYKYTIT